MIMKIPKVHKDKRKYNETDRSLRNCDNWFPFSGNSISLFYWRISPVEKKSLIDYDETSVILFQRLKFPKRAFNDHLHNYILYKWFS